MNHICDCALAFAEDSRTQEGLVDPCVQLEAHAAQLQDQEQRAGSPLSSRGEAAQQIETESLSSPASDSCSSAESPLSVTEAGEIRAEEEDEGEAGQLLGSFSDLGKVQDGKSAISSPINIMAVAADGRQGISDCTLPNCKS